MKRVLIILTIAIVLASFLVLADGNSSDNGGVSVGVNAGFSTGSDSGNSDAGANVSTENNMQNDQEQNQIQDRNEVRFELRQRTNLTQTQVQHILQLRNRLEASKQAGECPERCECSPETKTVRCELANGTRTLTIHAGNSNNTIFQVKDINASTRVILYKDGEMFYGMFKDNMTKPIILPDEVRDRIMNKTRARLQNETFNLTDNGEYHIEARKQARLFFIIPVKERAQFNVDAETGQVTRTRNSWWGFLARDVRANASVNSSANVSAGQ